MNESYVTLASNAQLRLAPRQFGVQRGVGRHRLSLQVAVSAANERADGLTISFAGDAHVNGLAPGGNFLGMIAPTSPQTIRRDGTWVVTFFLDLANEQIREIEDRRSDPGGGFDISFQLQAEAIRSDGSIEHGSGQMESLSVSREDWLRFLDQIGFRKVILAELDLPDRATRPALATAFEYFTAAQGRFAAGEYRLTAESLRHSLAAIVGEIAEEELNNGQIRAELGDAAGAARKGGVGYPERMELARKALKFVADLGAHPEVSETSRIEALAQLHMVAGLLQWFNHR